ncbi:microfibril-associated glycoprotein 4-like [Anopheles stephensi]|uniref:Fibrinogen C-terminal domain-containing protein n=1 Tax=Anopheles stephensi TaxID=30069 RepID=A0A182Y800_ANOST|nr:microfibril-associated glycoprotein 4-like [Anopheles stephensi]
MLAKIALLVCCAVTLLSQTSQHNYTHTDLKGFHFELLLTHLTELEARIQTTLQEIAFNQTRQLEDLKLHSNVPCGNVETIGKSNTILPNVNRMNYRRETIVGLDTDHKLDGEWTVFQWRFNGSLAFNRTWAEYRAGFGDTRAEHWLGLDNLWQLLAQGTAHELLVVMENIQGTTVYAHYSMFGIGTLAERYAIKVIGKYSGTAGDSLTFHIGAKFTTHDQDNDSHASNCATLYNGGWWFKDCYSCFLNGEYVTGSQSTERGLIWFSFTGPFSSLKSSKMMIRPQRT